MSDALIEKLRRPVDQGGFDGWSPDELSMAAADCIEQLRAALGTEQTMHAAWRKRAEEAEAELAVLRGAAPHQTREET